MSSKHAIEEARHREPTLQEEFAGLSDDDLMDFMNLAEDRTGIKGVLFISTVMGRHGPRVKYFEKTGKGQPSFSISITAEPKIIASSLPDRVVRRMEKPVTEWVRLNLDALLEYWNEGSYWIDQEDTFKARLIKLPPG